MAFGADTLKPVFTKIRHAVRRFWVLLNASYNTNAKQYDYPFTDAHLSQAD